MFSIHKPSQVEIEDFLLSVKEQDFSYAEVGSTRGQTPAGYTVDHNRVLLGSGSQVFRAAISAVRNWQMFNLGWVHLHQPATPIVVGATVAVLVKHFGFWSLNSCRVVYVIEEERKFGFAYGTLQQHAEQGEEVFCVEWNVEDDAVFYDIRAFSRPGQWQAKVARPLAGMLQRRFARDSMAAMKRAI